MKQALIIIDLINEIIGEHGKSNTSYAQTKERNIVAHANQAAHYAREYNIPVIWVKVGFADDYHDIPKHSPMFSKAKANQALKLSESGCDWVNELDVQPQDIIVVKKAVGAFAGNDLHQQLQAMGIEHLVIGGVSSTMTIESTTRLAHDLGYKITILQDLCAAATLALHEQSMLALQPMAEISERSTWYKSIKM